MITTEHTIVLIAVCSAVTVFVRFLPFIVFNGKRETPAFITYLGKVLPFAVIGMLVVFCFKETKVLSWPYGIPEAAAALVVVAVHVLKKNTLLSIISGTVCYMLLVQFVF